VPTADVFPVPSVPLYEGDAGFTLLGSTKTCWSSDSASPRCRALTVGTLVGTSTSSVLLVQNSILPATLSVLERPISVSSRARAFMLNARSDSRLGRAYPGHLAFTGPGTERGIYVFHVDNGRLRVLYLGDGLVLADFSDLATLGEIRGNDRLPRMIRLRQ
jgi:hypothetical protein